MTKKNWAMRNICQLTWKFLWKVWLMDKEKSINSPKVIVFHNVTKFCVTENTHFLNFD